MEQGAMENEMTEICRSLDGALIAALDEWREQLIRNEEEMGDPLAVYCLYPRLVSQIAWSRGTLQGAEASMRQLSQRQGLTQQGQMMAAMPGAVCCPCCGGAGAPMMQAAPCSCDEQEPVHRETRIIEETIVEETGNVRDKKTGRSARRS